MVQKRPFDDEGKFEVSAKHPKQVEHGHQLFSSLKSVFPEDASHIAQTSGDPGFIQISTGGHGKLAGDILAEHQESAQDVGTSDPGCSFTSSWPTSRTSEEDFRLGTPVRVSLFSEYFNYERPTRTMAHCEDIYSLLLNYPPRKPIPVGQNHQADIPAWGSQYTREASNHIGTSEVVLGSEQIVGEEDEKALMGTCVIPMPDLEQSACNDDQAVHGRIECLCDDRGSVRCIRQHITEAREKLREHLGQEKFVELGFLDMGELVADKWSDEEERLFHKIVYSNPASLGKKFWDILSFVFPSRTKEDIVSYYFNVFILRRRAEQNRCHPMNIDSDNDEWQGCEDSGDNGTGMSDEDEDSVVESPVYHEDLGCNQREGDLHIYEEDDVDATCANNEDADFVRGRGVTNISESYQGKALNSCGSNLSSQLHDETPWDERGNQEVQDDSCTSFDAGAASQGMQVNNDDHWPNSFNHLSNNDGVHEYVMPCDSKVWDAGFTSCPQNKVDFLSTCSMIEEVFGDGSSSNCPQNKVDFLSTCSMIEEVFGDGSSSNCKTRDGKSLN